MSQVVKVSVTSHQGPTCGDCGRVTTTFVVVEDIAPDYSVGDKGHYCPVCIKEELTDG